MVNRELFKRNEKLIKKRLEDQVEIGLDKGKSCIDKELSSVFHAAEELVLTRRDTTV